MGESWLAACSSPGFGDSGCVIGFVLPQNHGTKAEPGVVLRWQICRLKNTNSVIVLNLNLDQVQPIAFMLSNTQSLLEPVEALPSASLRSMILFIV